MIDDFCLELLVEPLQTWFGEHARTLPWREEPTPYHVWISEIMLQQTRVEAVKPFYERFMEELPDVAALAACPEDKLLKLWEGLGYYNRARNLKAAAQQITGCYGGVLPSDYGELLKLKGIGHYTAGAIASIAYQKQYPAVDGNVLRVISRVTADDSDIMQQSVRTHMEERLRLLMEAGAGGGEAVVCDPSRFNQALMELGATVCVPNGAPHCADCPWKELCRAYREKKTDVLPVKSRAKARRIEKRTVFVIRDGENILLNKRPDSGLLAGMYELPNEAGHMGVKEALAFLEERGFAPLRIQKLPEAKHIFSHVEWHMVGYLVSVPELEAAGGLCGNKERQWILADVGTVRTNYAIPTAFARYAAYMNIPLGKKET